MSIPIPIDFRSVIECQEQGTIDGEWTRRSRRKIFLFFDGTAQQFTSARGGRSGNSNVIKLLATIRASSEQLIYYRPGLGTMEDQSARYMATRYFSRLKGMAFGEGFKANVLDAYLFLMNNYVFGDDIYLFGFSRGAYIAQTLAGMIHSCGLLLPGNEELRFYAWERFQKAASRTRTHLKRAAEAEGVRADRIKSDLSFKEIHSRAVTIRFVGVWDTVSSLGFLRQPIGLPEMCKNPSVKVLRHAVSIDERRANYRDNLWGAAVDEDDPEWPAELRARELKQDFAQVWFPGVHCDVGGGYAQWESGPANQTLIWMVQEAQRHGAELCAERVDMVFGEYRGLFAAEQLFLKPNSDTHRLHESLHGLWWGLQILPQRYFDKTEGRLLWRTPLSVPRTLPNGAIIHGSAVNMMQVDPKYKPRNVPYEHLEKITSYHSWTTANLDGCYVLRTPKSFPVKQRFRILKLAVGWSIYAAVQTGIMALCFYLFLSIGHWIAVLLKHLE